MLLLMLADSTLSVGLLSAPQDFLKAPTLYFLLLPFAASRFSQVLWIEREGW
jgi:hypothetical protein